MGQEQPSYLKSRVKNDILIKMGKGGGKMQKRALCAVFFAVLCVLFIGCASEIGSEGDTVAVRDSDIALISEKTGVSPEAAEEIYSSLLGYGMGEGIKYVTAWDGKDGRFYRIRASVGVFDVYIEDGTFRIAEYAPEMPDTDAVVADTLPPLPPEGDVHVVINVKSKKYHTPDCASASKISEENRLDAYVEDENALHPLGYAPCAVCYGENGGESTETHHE